MARKPLFKNLENNFEESTTPGEYKVLHHTWCNVSCFTGGSLLTDVNGDTIKVKQVKQGMMILTQNGKATVKKVVQEVINCVDYVVRIDDGLTLSQNHPIYVDEDWYLPSELYQVEKEYVDCWYNFELCHDHVIKMGENGTLVCTLGKYCGDRLYELNPLADKLWGRGHFESNKVIV
eukprot:TRINITY_DN2278_c0_g2_i2.p1 TRINITY_DN2278_c0_g2~~TRINITY_DN2278_c0_g2_i2.p1  ORF type:complete len:177 (+),score=37.36 TRINITY_DN2278_c0_g2_i2:703-1233(+)